MGVGGQHHAPAALPPGKTRYPLYRRLDGPQGRSGRVRKISSTPGFDPRPVASRYTDWAIYVRLVLEWIQVEVEFAVRMVVLGSGRLLRMNSPSRLIQ